MKSCNFSHNLLREIDVGEFGKVQIDELCKYYDMKPEDYVSSNFNIRRIIHLVCPEASKLTHSSTDE
jgi:hypothetical protein